MDIIGKWIRNGDNDKKNNKSKNPTSNRQQNNKNQTPRYKSHGLGQHDNDDKNKRK